MVHPNILPQTSRNAACAVSIDSLTEAVLKRYTDRIESKNIRIEAELQSLTAAVFPAFIDSAVCKLIENAIESTPRGGELNVTLIDGEDCWELEVADSAFELTRSNNGGGSSLSDQVPGSVATGSVDKRARLEVIRRAATVHGGKIQTWDCPQGGTANVLVIPRRQEVNKAA